MSAALQNKKDKLDPDKAETALDLQRHLAQQAAQQRTGGGGGGADAAGGVPAVDAAGGAAAAGPGLRLNLTGVEALQMSNKLLGMSPML